MIDIDNISKPYCFCFNFILSDDDNIYCTSNAEAIEYNDNTFTSKSGIKLENLFLNDSAHNSIEIKGIFDKECISKENIYHIRSVKLLIYFFDAGEMHDWIVFYTEKYDYSESNFTIKFISEIYKTKKNLLRLYSRNCDVSFGGNECGIDVASYGKNFNVSKIQGKKITIKDYKYSDNYYNNGQIYVERKFKGNIISCSGGIILLREYPDCDIKVGREITLVPTCDKSLEECVSKYDNALNFRGTIISNK